MEKEKGGKDRDKHKGKERKGQKSRKETKAVAKQRRGKEEKGFQVTTPPTDNKKKLKTICTSTKTSTLAFTPRLPFYNNYHI